MNESPGASLLERLVRGDRTALADFYDLYSGPVYGIVLRLVREVPEAEDVVQEVFLQVWRQAERYDSSRGTPEAWLFTIARTRALDRLRRRAARREDTEEVAPAPTQVPQGETVLAVRKALLALSADQRRAVELAYYGGLTQSEIAETLGEPLGTIKTRIRTALIRLREKLRT